MAKEIEIRKSVKERYSQIAKRKTTRKASCCGGKKSYAEVFAGYTEQQIKELPEEVVNVSAGCGNPTALAELKEGQVVLDLGSGGGIDVFLSAKKVGEKGKAIGVDATPEMVWRARETANKINAKNVEFRLGEIECLPIEANSVDVIISNCVINLSPDKDRVFKEAYRVLRKGGKLAISDIVALDDFPEEIKNDLEKWSACLSGALMEEDYLQKIKNAGFVNVEVKERHIYTEEEIKDMFSSAEVLENIIKKKRKMPKIASDKIVAWKK